ncbi:MAG TPA: 50S ribosomal protein L23 [Anaerolineaceae bacterium]|jgi:large subunit ribosomal protein L23|nr:50S ribosomal protein L23 [Anaerolineaceae bacterium]NMC18293.1 50S ribosomal protein L23 [Chloroflexota bacterium]HNW14719.1 50S ribosomal protein L23 [Anaerolineaceae bacterium]HOE01921.1 50S ribosomal protein L23 [Anaerolineaceae bacterium]HOQ69764.1 50S ribosomal protein L23 [Anaerolineaceae bacterium]
MSTIYDVLRRPIVTEKTNYMVTKLHQYVFEVADDANRTMVKDAVEKLFNVNVLRVNIINAPAKRSRRARSRRLLIRNAEYKKAVVTLSPEDRIPIFEGVE